MGTTPENIITQQGEKVFRNIESDAAAEIGKRQGLVIATGGGTVTRQENMLALQQNGWMVFIERDLTMLATIGRPLSVDGRALEHLYQQRGPLYRHYADDTIINDGSLSSTVQQVINAFSRR